MSAIMSAIISQITGVGIIYSSVCSGADQRKHQSSASLAILRGIHRWPVTGEFPTQRASNAGNVCIWWRHHGSNSNPSACNKLKKKHKLCAFLKFVTVKYRPIRGSYIYTVRVKSHECHDISNYQPLNCWCNSCFRLVKTRNQESIKASFYWPFVRRIHVDLGFLSQTARNAKSVPMTLPHRFSGLPRRYRCNQSTASVSEKHLVRLWEQIMSFH